MSKEIPKKAIDELPDGVTILGWGGDFLRSDENECCIWLDSGKWSEYFDYPGISSNFLFAAKNDSEVVELNVTLGKLPWVERSKKDGGLPAKKSIYCAGAMRGVPYFNFPAFDAARDRLTAEGWFVVSPADIDRENGFDPKDLPEDTDWNDLSQLPFTIEDCFVRDIEALRKCDAIYMLKEWENSTGAQAEYWCAKWLHKEVLFEEKEEGGLSDGVLVSWDDLEACVVMPRDQEPSEQTNPKDSCGVKKVPLHGMPAPVLMECGLVKLHGDLKYGEYNWRDVGVRASIYYDALMRHMMAFWEGQDVDPDSGISHIAHAMTGLAVLRDSMMQGNWVDDRPKSTTNSDWLSDMNAIAEKMVSKHNGKADKV